MRPAIEGGLRAEGDVISEVSAARRAIIEQSADSLGRTWADGCRRELLQEGRRATGGWPGTLREARARVECALHVEMHCRKLPAITEVERELAVRTTYASARNAWRKCVDATTR
ncbi:MULTISPECIES: hypothetical protein [Sorangium]|uniref:hypothetical protein n=1 Tax=Sorangium TaxID=39643 RepID=UPI003D9C33B3